ncbi:MAG: Clp protease N-terminal domain-containing protein [Phycisphaerales bacterium]
MEPEPGIMLVWPIAAMEAQALGWSQIEPAHLLCAILKVAELDGADLERLSEANGNLGNLAQEQRDLRAHLDDPWGIKVPEVSTPLRRALRRRGDGRQKPTPGGMVHRSDAAREVFCIAQGVAEQAGRQRLGLGDLACAILGRPDEWIRRGLDQHGVLSASQRAERDQAMEQWGDVFVPLAPSGSVDDAERKRILADPAVRVLADTLAKPASRPCLLIHGPDRTAHDVLIDVLNRPSDNKPPKVVQINSRVLLARLSQDANISAADFLDFLCDEANQKTVWFFDSLHRYLAEELTPSGFRLRFVQWLKRTNGRFLFAISENQYTKLVEQHCDWTNTFQSIWIHSRSQSVGIEL